MYLVFSWNTFSKLYAVSTVLGLKSEKSRGLNSDDFVLFLIVVFNVNKNLYYLRYSSFRRMIYTFLQSFQIETFSLTSSEFSRSVCEVHSWNPFRLLLPTHARQWGCVTGFQKEQVFVRTVAFGETKRNRQWESLEHNHFREHYSVWVLLAAVFPNFSLNG